MSVTDLEGPLNVTNYLLKNGPRLRPIEDWVLIRVKERPEKVTDSGIILPEVEDEKLKQTLGGGIPLQAEVLAVGPGKKDIEMQVKAGDQVLVKYHAGYLVDLGQKEKFRCCQQHEVLGILE